MENKIAEALQHVFISPNESDRNLEAANVVDGLFHIARSIQKVADALNRLGLGTQVEGEVPPTRMGAIELLAKEIHNFGKKE